MRLLDCHYGELILTKELHHDIPPYAILSHTWGPDTEEVTYADLVHGTGLEKSGYQKLKFCAAQARRDGLQYIWVDTCCIDKSNNTVLHEAINSMFRWYRNAARCYVYLADVSVPVSESVSQSIDNVHWETAFRNSRWFTRGWTLQELIAPASVEFFSENGHRLGDKESLVQKVHEITGIAIPALQGTALSEFDIEERFKWAETRSTTREEDWAYCLLGIFDVFMPLLYGEGKTRAIRRLKKEVSDAVSLGPEGHDEAPLRSFTLSEVDQKCLRDVQSATDPYHDKARIERTKGGLLQNSYRWVLDNPEFLQWRQSLGGQLLWIKGDPGKGKTMLMCGIIDELTSSGSLSFFFCQATDARINSATAVLRGLIYLLVKEQPSLISHVREKYDDTGERLYADRNTWEALSDIFTDMLQDPDLKTSYILIDALDECSEGLPELLGLIAELSDSTDMKWIVSSRNERHIEEELGSATDQVRLCLEMNEASISDAVGAYILHKVDQLAQRKKYDASMKNDVQQYLTTNANNTFLWVALVCQELASPKVQKRHTIKILNSFPPGLDPLYRRMFTKIDGLDADLCKEILALLSVAYRPLTLAELMSLIQSHDAGDDLETWEDLIGSCGSFLTLRDSVVSFVHQSAKDFLFGKAADQVFPRGKDHEHHRIALKSLELLSTTLQRDIYHLCAPGFPIDQVSPPNPDPLAAAKYSCIYWIDHFCLSPESEDMRDDGPIHTFLKEKYLYWIEALSLLRSISEGTIAVQELEQLSHKMGKHVADFLRDARRFILYYKWIVENAPLQVYASALVFAPKNSVIRRQFEDCIPEFILQTPEVPAEWNACIQILEGHSHGVSAVAFSSDGKTAASGSVDDSVRLWDVATGALLHILEGHKDGVRSIAFSPDSKSIAVGSGGDAILLWDMATGQLRQALGGLSAEVGAVAFSPDNNTVASGSVDTIVRLWDAATSELRQILEGHSGAIDVIVFSPDGKTIASGSVDCTVRLWDAATGELRHILDEHTNSISAISFSLDGKIVASASHDNTVMLWSIATGKLYQEVPYQALEDLELCARAITFMPNTTTIMLGLKDMTVLLWNPADGKQQEILEGNNEIYRVVAFSPDCKMAISGSERSGISTVQVRLWDVSPKEPQPSTPEGDRSWLNAVVFSPSGEMVAAGSIDGTVSLWDAATEELRWEVRNGHESCIYTVRFSPDGKMLASGSEDETVKLWDTATGELRQLLESPNSFIRAVAFSPDGKFVASSAGEGEVEFWDAATGVLQKQPKLETGSIHFITAVAFSADGTTVATGSESVDDTARLWDAVTGEQLLEVGDSSCAAVSAVALSPDGKTVALACADTTVRLLDVTTGAVQDELEVGDLCMNLSFSTDNRSLWTDKGVIDVVPSSSTKRTGNTCLQATGYILKEDWLVRGGENLLWLPPDYRPRCSAFYRDTFVLGHFSGLLQFLRLKP